MKCARNRGCELMRSQFPKLSARLRCGDRGSRSIATASPPAKMKSSTPAARHARLEFARPASERDAFHARSLERAARRLPPVRHMRRRSRIGRRAGPPLSFSACDRLLSRRGLAIVDSLETANFEPLAHELHPAAMLCLRPQCGEINLRPRASRGRRKASEQSRKRSNGSASRIGAIAPSTLRQRLAFRRANRKLDRRLGEIGMGAHAGDRRLETRGVANQRRRAGGDLTLKPAARERRGQAALTLDLLKEPPGLVAKRVGHRLEGPRAGSGIGHKSEVRFAQKNELRVAGETPREAVGKAGRQSVRQNADAVSAAEAS